MPQNQLTPDEALREDVRREFARQQYDRACAEWTRAWRACFALTLWALVAAIWVPMLARIW